MATKKQVDAAIKKAFGKTGYLEWRNAPSSEESRKQAQAAFDEANQAMKDAKAAYEKFKPSGFAELVRQARFFVDTQASNAFDALASALLSAEAEMEAKANYEAACVEKRAVERRGGRYYYRYKALTHHGIFCTVEAEADTLDELLEKVHAKSDGRPKAREYSFS